MDGTTVIDRAERFRPKNKFVVSGDMLFTDDTSNLSKFTILDQKKIQTQIFLSFFGLSEIDAGVTNKFRWE